MKTYLLNLWDSLRASYWFIPSVFAVAALVLSFVLPRVDVAVANSNVQLPEWMTTTIDTARSTLSAMAGAMIAVTGTVFSITIVTLSLTSQQFGPRLLRTFMYDLTTQVTLGVFLSTGFYCLLLLRAVEKYEGGLSIPHLSILASIVLAVLSMCMLIVFIHHVAMMIQAPHVVAEVSRDLDAAIEQLFPDRIGESAGAEILVNAAERDQEASLGEDFVVIDSQHEGYVQAVAAENLLKWACDNDLVVRLRSRPGDFIAIDSPIADIWSADERPIDKLTAEELRSKLNGTIIVGNRRTPRQDVECAVDELVEVAVRALSPGINDPFTAMNCVDRLGASLGRLAERQPPTSHRCDEAGRLRIIARPISFGDVLAAAFNQIRQYGRDSVAVTIRLLESLAAIAQHLQSDEDRAAVQLHAEMIARHADSLTEEFDRQEIQERFERVMKALNPN